jgi:hypothetical protein
MSQRTLPYKVLCLLEVRLEFFKWKPNSTVLYIVNLRNRPLILLGPFYSGALDGKLDEKNDHQISCGFTQKISVKFHGGADSKVNLCLIFS